MRALIIGVVSALALSGAANAQHAAQNFVAGSAAGFLADQINGELFSPFGRGSGDVGAHHDPGSAKTSSLFRFAHVG